MDHRRSPLDDDEDDFIATSTPPLSSGEDDDEHEIDHRLHEQTRSQLILNDL